MRTRRSTVKFTANFEANLDIIHAFWAKSDYPQGYDRLLNELGDTVIPNLERFPAMGRPFMARRAESIEAVFAQEKLQAQLAQLGDDSDIRQYLMDDYLVLYAIIDQTVYLLSVRHHKQLSFDFARLW